MFANMCAHFINLDFLNYRLKYFVLAGMKNVSDQKYFAITFIARNVFLLYSST